MADPTIDDLYKSLQAAHAAGDTQSAQALADYIRSLPAPTPSEKQIEMTTGAPLSVRAAVGSSSTMQDKLATLKKFFPDAQPYDKDNFIYTDPKTGRPTLMNEKNPVLFGVPLPTMGDIAGALPEISEFVGAGTGAAAMSPFGPPAMVAGAGAGGAAFKKLYEMGMQYGGPSVETRGGTEQAAGVTKDILINALGQRGGQLAEKYLPQLLTPIQQQLMGLRQGIPQAASRLGIKLPAGVATQSPAVQRLEAGLAQTPGGAQVIAPKYELMQEQMGTAARNIAEDISQVGKTPSVIPTPPFKEKGGLGQFIQKGAEAAGKRFEERREQLDDIVESAVGSNNRFPATNTAQLVAQLQAEIAKSPQTLGPIYQPVIDRAMRIVSDAQSGFGGVPFAALRKERTSIGKDLARPDISGLSDTSNFARLYDALRKDVLAAANQSGNIASRAIKLHDRYVRFNREVNLPALQKIADQNLDVNAVNYAMAGTKDGMGRLQLLVRNFKPEERDTLAASVWQQLGNAKAGMKEGADVGVDSYEFNANTFLTNWNNLSDSAKQVLFGGERYRNIIPAINDLVKVTTGAREAGKAVNVSNTGGAQMVTSALLGASGAIGGGIGGDMTQALLGGAGALSGLVLSSNLAAKLLESPRFIRWVSDTSRAVVNNPNSLTTQIAKLSAIATAEPGMSDAIEAYYKQIKPIAAEVRRAR
jgi:hypothetical protein